MRPKGGMTQPFQRNLIAPLREKGGSFAATYEAEFIRNSEGQGIGPSAESAK